MIVHESFYTTICYVKQEVSKKYKQVYVRVECRCLSGFSSSLIVGPGLEPVRVPGGGVLTVMICRDRHHTHTGVLLQVDTTIAGIFCILVDQ